MKNPISERKQNFISRSIEIHGNRYSYSIDEYTTNKNNITIFCNIHGVTFSQTPANNLTGKGGCPECSKISFSKNKSIPFSKFVSDSVEKHGNKYRLFNIY